MSGIDRFFFSVLAIITATFITLIGYSIFDAYEQWISCDEKHPYAKTKLIEGQCYFKTELGWILEGEQ